MTLQTVLKLNLTGLDNFTAINERAGRFILREDYRPGNHTGLH
jgi:hypothetical protein